MLPSCESSRLAQMWFSGAEEFPRFKVTWMNEWALNLKSQKIPGTELKPSPPPSSPPIFLKSNSMWNEQNDIKQEPRVLWKKIRRVIFLDSVYFTYAGPLLRSSGQVYQKAAQSGRFTKTSPRVSGNIRPCSTWTCQGKKEWGKLRRFYIGLIWSRHLLKMSAIGWAGTHWKEGSY